MLENNEPDQGDLFNLRYPWKIRTIRCSIQHQTVEYRIDYDSDIINCPICGTFAKVIDKKIVSWNSSEAHSCMTKMTACLPVIDCHNSACRVDKDQTVLSNYLLLDLIASQTKFTGKTSPFGVLPNSVEDS